MSVGRRGLAVTFVTLAGGAGQITGSGHVAGPPAGHTGGFGEPTCTACHADAPVNDGVGTLDLLGLPTTVEPGRAYPLVVRLERPGLSRAGFQLAVRFAAGRQAGTQAGEITVVDSAVQVITDAARGVLYAEQTPVGAAVRNNVGSWTVLWRAPSEGHAPVVIHVVGNASNDDDSELGDAVYAMERRTEMSR